MSDTTLSTDMNVRGVSNLVQSGMNKVPGGAYDGEEGVAGELEDILDLADTDEELLRLAKRREALYAPYEGKIKPRQEKNRKYYKGDQLRGSTYESLDNEPIAGNFIFDAVETFLPAALAKNPEPVVYCDDTTEGNAVADDVKTLLQFHADTLVLRRKLHYVTRQWVNDFLGVMKHGWNDTIGDITSDIRKVQDFILDPNGYVDPYGDFSSWIGERITISAEKLAEQFPKHKEYIAEIVEQKMGTDVTYTEWWEDELTYCTFKEKVLDKSKNPFFNYPQTQQPGLPAPQERRNHFAAPKKPYTFLSVFSLQEQPHDITGLIEQNIPNQNLVARRTKQIDYNLSKANNSDVFSEDNFTQETGKQASQAMAKGNPVLIPPGRPISEAIARLPAPTLADAFFKDQEVNKDALRSIFGVQGISATQPTEDTTARGMILNQQYDNTRIGGGIGEALEQFADNVFNWWTQLYHVFYDEAHFAAVLGQLKAVEYVTLSNLRFDRQLIISVAPDSMKPKDELTIMNQALELWGQKALDIKTLLTVLKFPDPQKTAAQVWLYNTNPMLYGQLNFPELMQEMQGPAPQSPGGAQPQPTEPPATLSSEPANASLSQVPLPA